MKLAYILLVVWEGGHSEILTNNYDHCWELDGIFRQEIEYWTPEGAGALEMTRCEPTQIITEVGFPKLRPEDLNDE